MTGVKQKISSTLVTAVTLLSLACAPLARADESTGTAENNGTLTNTALKTITGGLAGHHETNESGKRACKDHRDRENPADPCHKAELMEKGADAQGTAAKVYSIAAALCLTQCVASFTPVGAVGETINYCKLAGYAALGTDIVMAFQVGQAGQSIMSSITGPLTMAGMGALGGGGEAAKEGSKEAGKEGADEGRKVDKQACLSAGMNVLQAGVRYYNQGVSQDQANQAYMEKLRMMGEAPKLGAVSSALSGEDSSNKGGIKAEQKVGGRIESTEKAQVADEKKDFEELAAEAGQTPLLRAFEKVTGKPISEFDNKVNSGMPPFLAAADTASAQLGAEGLQAAANLEALSAQMGPELRAQLDEDDKKTGISQKTFASFEGGSARRGGGGESADSGFPDIHALMAGLMPKKPAEAKPQGPKMLVNFGGRDPAVATSGMNKDLHQPSKSLFEVVGLRYRIVAQDFLSGNTVTKGKPASLLPENMYLRR